MVTHVAFFVIYGWLAMLMASETQEPNLLALTKLLHDFDIVRRTCSRFLISCPKRLSVG
jgi:hypothetical protein